MGASDFSGSCISGSVANNTLELFIDAVRYKSRREDPFKNISDDLPGLFVILIKTHFLLVKTVHLQGRMSVVFIVEPATFQDFEQFIYVID